MNAPHPETAFRQLAERMPDIGVQTVLLSDAAGRIQAMPLLANRDSPPFDCSSMDGFAVRLKDLTASDLPVRGEGRLGQEPPALEANAAVRVSTGSPIPIGADTVIPVEDAQEKDGRIALAGGAQPHIGQNIRRRGENAVAGTTILGSGVILRAAHIGAMAAFGHSKASVRNRLRIAVITTGDELIPPGCPVTQWRIIDSNLAALCASVLCIPWLELVAAVRVADDVAAMTAALHGALANADVILTTGGVSRGHRDFMPAAIRAAGGEVLFHRLPIKPGGPVLGAIAAGKAVFGLPGNPVSALVLWRRFVLPCLALHVGCSRSFGADLQVELTNPPDDLPMKWCYRLVRIAGIGRAELIRCASSGDIPAAATSDGFIEVPPDKTTDVTFPFFSWSIA